MAASMLNPQSPKQIVRNPEHNSGEIPPSLLIPVQFEADSKQLLA
jgi:hypothetical protein